MIRMNVPIQKLETAMKTKFVEWVSYVTAKDSQELQMAKFQHYGLEYDQYLDLVRPC